MFVVLNSRGFVWGQEAYPSVDIARSELRRFFREESIKVDLGKFYIVPEGAAPKDGERFAEYVSRCGTPTITGTA